MTRTRPKTVSNIPDISNLAFYLASSPMQFVSGFYHSASVSTDHLSVNLIHLLGMNRDPGPWIVWGLPAILRHKVGAKMPDCHVVIMGSTFGRKVSRSSLHLLNVGHFLQS